MPQTTLTVKLVGSEDDDGFVRFDEFTGFCRALSKCLRRISDAANPGGDKIYYRVVAMEAASAAVTLEAIHPTAGKNRGEAVFRLFRDTAIRLQDGKAPDKRLTFEDIEAFRELLLPLDRHASEVWVDGFQLTFNAVTSIESIVGNAIPSNGEVTGSLERLNLHDRYEFVSFPAAGSRIVCTFEESLLEQVRRGIKRVVTAFGVPLLSTG